MWLYIRNRAFDFLGRKPGDKEGAKSRNDNSWKKMGPSCHIMRGK
jgi:hypothetical protein